MTQPIHPVYPEEETEGEERRLPNRSIGGTVRSYRRFPCGARSASSTGLAIALVSLPVALSGCDDDDFCCGGHTDVFGIVLLDGNPVEGAIVRIIFDGFIEDTEITAADGTFLFQDYPEEWDPFFVEAFYIDPVTLNEYTGVTPFMLTNEDGDTDAGTIVLVQTFPATAGPHNARGDLDGDGIDDLALAFTDMLGVMLSSSESRILATAADHAGPFGTVAVRDEDGDGHLDVVVNRLGSGAIEIHPGDGKGGFRTP